jgi:hypothetical protein
MTLGIQNLNSKCYHYNFDEKNVNYVGSSNWAFRGVISCTIQAIYIITGFRFSVLEIFLGHDPI